MKKIMVVGVVAAIAGVVICVVAAQQGDKAQDAAAPSPVAPAAFAASPVPDAGQAAEPKAADSQDAPKTPVDAGTEGKPDNAMAAMKQASEGGKYLFVFFYGKGNEQTDTLRKSFEVAASAIADKAMSVAVDVNSPAEKEIVARFQVQNAPMPLVLAIAPNGAVTGSYQGESSEEGMLEKIVSPALRNCLKPLQEGKLVFLCVLNNTTTSNDAAMQGVDDFQSDARFAKVTEIIMVDPSDAAEGKLMTELGIDPKGGQAITVMLTPPGAAVAKVAGPTSKDAFIAAIQKATSGGCGAGGCGPKGCGPTPPPQQ